jgi:hypothetical protein
MGRATWVIAATMTLAVTAGCNRNCQNTCTRIYDECDINVPGVTKTQSVADCEQSCESALKKAGTMGAYDPFGRDISGDGAELENEVQAAAWMECVWEVGCEDIGPNGSALCWPI